MALRKSMIFLVTMALCGACSGAVYKVGDSNGWTSRGHVDYNKWASTKDFHVGDTLIFYYNNQLHSVMQVSDQDFQSCNTTSPIAAYTSGFDTLIFKKAGHFHFLCGAPYHCQVGQKVEIKVTPIPINRSLVSPSPSPSASHPKDSPNLVIGSAARALQSSNLGLAVTIVVLCLVGFIF